MSQEELTESFDFNYKVIQEDSRDNNESKKLTKLRGLFQQGNIKNGNGRLYPTSILELAVKASTQKIH